VKKVHQLRESAQSKPTKVDWDKGIIYGVKVLSESSRNGFVYPRSTREKAHRILENLRVNIDHKEKGKEKQDIRFVERFGKLINPREGSGGTFCDLKFNKKHALAESIAYAAEYLDDTLGMSINGIGYGTKVDGQGRKIVEEIARLRSCDVVADPGSTHSLFESQQMEEELPGTDPGVAASLTGMKAAVTHLVENAQDEAALVNALAAWCEKQNPKDEEEEEAEVKESLSETEQLARLTTEKACLVLCESLKVEPSSDLIELLADLPSEEKRKALIAKVGVKKGVKAPKSAPMPLRESAPVQAPAPDPAAERARLAGILRGRN
jgi:hypothetical protein